MLNVKVTRLQPVVSQNANKLRAIADIEIGNGLMIYGLLYKLNKDNEFYVQMPQHMGRDGDYHSTVEPLSKEFAARIKSEVEKANIEGKNYTPTSEESEPLRFTFNELLVDYAKEHGNRLPIRVNFFLDEFGNFTPISDIQAKLTVARGYGIRFNLFIQDMAQLEDKYDKNVANIIMGNCTVWVYLAAAGKETNELISSKLGKYTTLKYSSSGNKARYSNPSSGFSSQLEGRELLTADELARFARPYQLVMVLGEYPAVMVSYDLHKWQFNRFMGLGNESHNKQYIQIVTDSRPDKRNTNAKIPLWEIWKEQTPQETEYNYLLRRKEVQENNEKSETYDITKNAFYITEDEVINKGQDLFRRKEQ